ncbi:MAG: winged helix-turn-helix transcriptional regulator [Thermoplasmata archaeon]|nr:MAG: winged helix-turn-helix transcriptional regulator [Thermoplasmata archaeon]
MPRRMVDALKKEIEEDKEVPEGLEERVKETITMNPRRQEILQYLCKYPCTRLSKIARELELSNASTKWHLNILAQKNFIVREDVNGDSVFYPAKMIAEEDIEALTVINHERATPILRKILSNSGINQKDLCDDVQLNQRTVVRHTKDLERIGLIECIQDGKFKRYYPTVLIEKKEESYRKKAAKFRKHLLKMLEKDGVKPRVVRTTDRSLHVKITTGEKKSVLELGTQPYLSIRERYKGL